MSNLSHSFFFIPYNIRFGVIRIGSKANVTAQSGWEGVPQLFAPIKDELVRKNRGKRKVIRYIHRSVKKGTTNRWMSKFGRK
jgi:hypothetical protein